MKLMRNIILILMKLLTMIKFNICIQRNMRRESGFTLIELLIVISIISIFASVIMAGFRDAHMSNRDSIRMSDMYQIGTALELFYFDYGRYPNSSIDGLPASGEVIGMGHTIDDLLRPYLDPVPADPRHDDPSGTYFYSFDSSHRIDTDCAAPAPPSGLVYGFNQAETGRFFAKDTCLGGDMNLNEADFNRGIIRGSN
ncbi:MAG: prepilin-type N-terminal cleavage/methylation domain-containing protein [Candidatus Paceibacteria bacterium]|jgi:prepilin-type N-terminal cleavage/methylation domain-containing protein